jgi:hypothetical protein
VSGPGFEVRFHQIAGEYGDVMRTGGCNRFTCDLFVEVSDAPQLVPT